MNQKFFTYVLKSERDGHLYVGLTSNLKRRVEEHNKGKVRSTKSRKPLRVVYYEEYEDKTSGRKREIFLKSGQGRLYLKNKLIELASGAVSPAEGGSRVRIPASPP
ncbi:MAG TPA: GIY-YIG nuclease family protein [candidate division Zixibacteria bacterium]